VIRCPHALRSYAGAACLAATLAVSVAACGGDGGDELDSRTDPVPTTTTGAGPTTSVLMVSEPPTTTTPAATAPDPGGDIGTEIGTEIDEELASIDADLSELDAALNDFDQMTATTEGDPSK
jgi:hypothetical protein